MHVRLALRLLTGLLSICAFAQTPTFSPVTAFPVQTAPLAVAAADFNGDGFQDFAIANAESETISVFLGAGNGLFSAAATITLRECQVAYLTTGKFSGAAGPDLLAVCPLGGFLVLPNTGKGTFGNPIQSLMPQGAWVGNLLLGSIHPTIADFNRDGHLDIAITAFDASNGFAGYWYILLGQGDGTFKGATQLPFAGDLPVSMVAGDFNGDGKPDLVTAAYNIPLALPITPTLTLYFSAGNGDGTFAQPVSFPLPEAAGSILLAADLNGDGNLDIVVAGSATVPNLLNIATFQQFQGDSAVTVLLGDGKGNFSQSFNVTEPSFMTGATLADVFAAGTLDLIETTIQANFYVAQLPIGAVTVRPGNGDGTFGNPIALSVPTSTIPTDVATADFNGDGKPDILFSSVPGASVMINIGLSSDFNSILNSVLALLPQGNGDILLNETVPSAFRDVNAASFVTGPLAKGSIVSAFGTNLAGSTATATTVPQPIKLGGDTVTIQDASGASISAPLFFVSPGQINFAIPDNAATGQAIITIQSGATALTASQQIVSVAPGIFSSNGLAVGASVRLVNGVQQSTSLLQNGALVPIDVSGGQTFLILYGTGIHNHMNPAVATVGGQKVNAAYAGAQGVYLGEDQINIQLPATLQGAGVIGVSLTVDGQSSNSVKISVQ
jgi:uncharacterized protein (TIGR03437 family)